ncbi:hypothetical protein C9439_08095 [archaeon SCG-AAA382B04]|nr:hypothetical protein C9439_08095 [archaeon SCG-AAA382B04]
MRDNIKVLIAFATLASISNSMLLPYIPVYAKAEAGMPLALVGYLVFIYYGTEMITRIPIGSIGEYSGHNTMVINGGLAILLAASLYYTSEIFWPLLFLGQIFFGIGFSVTWVTIPSFITKADSSLSIYTSIVGLGWLFGPLIGGSVKQGLGMEALFLLFLFFSIILFLMSMLFYYLVSKRNFLGEASEKTLKKRFPTALTLFCLVENTVGSFKESIKLIKRDKILISILISFIMFMSFAISNASVLPIFVVDYLGYSDFFVAIFVAVNTAAASLIRLKANYIVEKGGKVKTLLISTLLTGVIIVAVSYATNKFALLFLSSLWGIAGGLYLPVVFGLIADATHKEKERGLGMGLRGTFGTAGSAIGVLVFLNIGGIFDIKFALEVFGLFMIAFSVGLTIYWELRKRYLR